MDPWSLQVAHHCSEPQTQVPRETSCWMASETQEWKGQRGRMGAEQPWSVRKAERGRSGTEEVSMVRAQVWKDGRKKPAAWGQGGPSLSLCSLIPGGMPPGTPQKPATLNGEGDLL